MKKMWFKALCLVLVMALLAPNVFAATPTPEVPLADEATVARVRQEIADGEITDMEDLFLVAYQHLGADLEEEGMTAYINEDGTLGITQIISSEKKMTRSGIVETKKLAVMTAGSFDNQGRLLDNTWLELYPYYDTGNANGVVHATLTTYVKFEFVELFEAGAEDRNPTRVGLDSMRTTIIHTQTGYVSSKLVQSYVAYESFAVTNPDQGSLTTNWPASGTHTYAINGELYGITSGTPSGYLATFSTLTVQNISNPIELSFYLPFADIDSYIEPTD